MLSLGWDATTALAMSPPLYPGAETPGASIWRAIRPMIRRVPRSHRGGSIKRGASTLHRITGALYTWRSDQISLSAKCSVISPHALSWKSDCTDGPDQVADEIERALAFSLYVLRAFGLTEFKGYLSTRPDKFVGEVADWERASEALRRALVAQAIPYDVDEGGAF